MCDHDRHTAVVARPSPQTDRVVALVDLLTRHPDEPWTLATLTRRLGVNKSTTHAILASLHGSGWLLRDPVRKTYRLGPALVEVGRAADSGTPALDFARPVATGLAGELELHCAVLVVSDDTLTVAYQASVFPAVAPALGAGLGSALRAGSAFPLRAPFGAAAVAWGDPRAVTAWLGPLPPERREHHRAALAAIRRRGYAVELAATPADRVRELLDELRGDGAPAGDGPPTRELLERLAGDLAQGEEYLATELDDRTDLRVTAINAPVHDHTGQVVLVLSLNGFAAPLSAATVEGVGVRLVAATRDLSQALGAPVGDGVPGWATLGRGDGSRRGDAVRHGDAPIDRDTSTVRDAPTGHERHDEMDRRLVAAPHAQEHA
jgi:DNA-binding IclR family transcriptional regulator